MLPMPGPPQRRRLSITLSSTVALCLGVAAPASAQTVISSQGRGTVVVNSDALDALGPAPTVPQLLDPNLMSSQTQRLRPSGTLAAPGAAPGAVPRSRIYPLPPASTASASAPAPLPRSGLARAPEMPVSRVATLPAVAETPQPPPPAVAETPAPMRTVAASPPPISPPSFSPPPVSPPPAPPVASPAEMRMSRAPMTASAPPPPPALEAPAPPRTPTRSPTPAASAPPVSSPPPVAAAAPAPPPPMPTPMPSPMPAMPPSAPMAAPSAAPTQVAAAPGVLSRVLFTSGSADLNDAGRRELGQLASRLGREGDGRIQLLAYADGTPESESQARRLSLSRALAVRSFLIEQGIRSTRVNVQALGIKTAGGPADRVDAMAVGP